MAKISISTAAAEYVNAKKAMSKHDRPPSAAERATLADRLAGAEAELLRAVGALIGKTVTGAHR